MSEEYEIGTYTEDDSVKIPDYMLKMSPEELEQEAEKLYMEMKANPQKKEKPECSVKFYL